MIISKIIGGLGNQMFQYAFGRSLSIKYHYDLKLDLSGFETYDSRVFELDVFGFKIEKARCDEIEFIQKPRYFPFPNKDYFRFGNLNLVLDEANFLFDPKNLKIKKNTFVSGYWQSEKYFLGIRDLLLADFAFKPSEDENVIVQSSNILATSNSVSVHIRRGDYVQNSEANKYHGVLTVEYYKEAIKLLSLKLDDPIFYFFSDDIEWVKQELNNFQKGYFIDFNIGKNNFEDMRLMSLCAHNIIANSSFSWWGAWLNTNLNKIVIAPKQWFADPVKNEEARDIIPDSWIKL